MQNRQTIDRSSLLLETIKDQKKKARKNDLANQPQNKTKKAKGKKS